MKMEFKQEALIIKSEVSETMIRIERYGDHFMVLLASRDRMRKMRTESVVVPEEQLVLIGKTSTGMPGPS
jgi:hypothetical protein